MTSRTGEPPLETMLALTKINKFLLIAFGGRLKKATQQRNIPQNGNLVVHRFDLFSRKPTDDDRRTIKDGYGGIDFADGENRHQYAGWLNDHRGGANL